MHRVRNAVVIIILCIIGAMTFKSRAPQLTLNMPSNDLKDSVAGNGVHHKAPHLTLASGNGEDLRDSVAGHAVGTPNNHNTVDDVPPPPRGSGNGGFGTLGSNPGQNQNPPNISQSAPPSENPQCGDCINRD